MIKLQMLIGSASYGLSTETSDTDIYIVGSGGYTLPDGRKPHIIRDTKEVYVQKALLEHRKHPLFLQTLFPAAFLLDTEAAAYIRQTREAVVRAQRKKVYEAHMEIAEGLLTDAQTWYRAFPKRIAYGIMFYDTVSRYAKGADFAEAVCPDDLQRWLLDVREGKVELGMILDMIRQKKAAAETVAAFFDRAQDEAFLQDWKAGMLGILEE